MDTIQSTRQWLLDRGISEQVLRENHITVDGKNRVVIPIKDAAGGTLFNKYRRDPLSDEGPKYTYDTGAVSALYGIHRKIGQHVIICEGELDSLRVESLGLSALSSTSGSQTFRLEWTNSFIRGHSVVICYDNDEPGLKGAISLQAMLPDATFVFLPREKGVKDITDYVQKYGEFAFKKLVYEAKSYLLPNDHFVEDTKQSLDTAIKSAMLLADGYLEQVNAAKAKRLPWQHLDALREYSLRKYEQYKERREYLRPAKMQVQTVTGYNFTIDDAKKVPIKEFLQVPRAGFVKCLWHEEKNASMKFYGDNHLFCFGCGKYADVIDVVMTQQKIDFGEAMKLLSAHHV